MLTPHVSPPGSPAVTPPPPPEEPQLVNSDSEEDPSEDTATQMSVSSIVSPAEPEPVLVREDSPILSVEPQVSIKADTPPVPAYMSAYLARDHDFVFAHHRS